MQIADELRALSARHPAPEGHVPVKSTLGELIDRYGVGNIPLSELHRANTISRAQLDEIRLKQAARATAAAARTAEADRHEQMAIEWEASHGGR